MVEFEVIYFANGASIWDKGPDGYKTIKHRIGCNGYETVSVTFTSFDQAYAWILEGQ